MTKRDRTEYMREYQKANRERLRIERAEYMRNYYDANKERLAANRKAKPRTEANKRAEERYREKKRLLKEISEMQHGPVGGSHERL